MKLTVGTELDERIDATICMCIEYKKIQEQIYVMDDFCTNKKCKCRDITLSFLKSNEDSTINEWIRIKVNIDTWDILQQNIFDDVKEGQIFLDDFFATITEDNKKEIVDRFIFGKLTGGEVRVTNLDTVKLKKSSTMIFNDLFKKKREKTPTVEIEDKEYIISDMYCTNASCKCNDAIIVFLRETKENVFHSSFVIRLDLKTKKYEIEDNIENYSVDKINVIVEEVKAKMGDKWIKLFKERYKLMKKIRKIYPELNDDTEQDNKLEFKQNTKKVGRNDPCPCGSGKKYKKCCLK